MKSIPPPPHNGKTIRLLLIALFFYGLAFLFLCLLGHAIGMFLPLTI